MKVSRWIALAGVAAVIAVVTTSAALGGGSSSKTNKASFKAALVSDVIGFNDAGFNRNQLKGLNKAVKKVGGTAIPEVSHATSDYAPNFNAAIRKGAKLVVAAGFLLAPTEATYAKKFPNVKFAITDYTVHAAPFADKKGKVLPTFKNVEGITYAANESGCLVGVLAAKMAQKLGGHAIGAVGGLKIPPVTIWIAGYSTARTRQCRERRRSFSTRTTSAPRTSARPSPRTRSGRARRCSSRSPAAAGIGTLKAA